MCNALIVLFDLGKTVRGVVDVGLNCVALGFSLALAAGGIVAYDAGGVGAFGQLIKSVVVVSGGAAHGPGFDFKIVVFVVGEAVGVADGKNINLRKYPYSL